MARSGHSIWWYIYNYRDWFLARWEDIKRFARYVYYGSINTYKSICRARAWCVGSAAKKVYNYYGAASNVQLLYLRNHQFTLSGYNMLVGTFRILMHPSLHFLFFISTITKKSYNFRVFTFTFRRILRLLISKNFLLSCRATALGVVALFLHAKKAVHTWRPLSIRLPYFKKIKTRTYYFI